MKIIVIGGAGFIGSHVAERFLKEHHHVTILDNFVRPGSERTLGALKASYPTLASVPCDIVKEGEALKRAISGADVVCHLAGQVAVTTSVKDPIGDFEANARGTLNILEAVRLEAPQAAVIFSSTNKVYGDLQDIPLREDKTRYSLADGRPGIDERQPLDFYSPYGCSKGAADQYVHDYHRIYGLKTVVFRQSCIYGQRQFGHEDQGWLAWFAIASMLGRPLTLYGNGKQVRDALYMDDLVDAFMAASQKIDAVAGHIFNIGGGPMHTLSLLELIAWLEKCFDRTLEIHYKETRPGDQKLYISDIRKIQQVLGWTPRVSLEEGLSRMMHWIESNASFFKEKWGTVSR